MTTAKPTYIQEDLDGCGPRRHRVYAMPATKMDHDYWSTVTDVACPREACQGIIRWAENGYVPGYRICDGCGAHFIAAGSAQAPTLIQARAAGQRTDLTRQIMASGKARRSAALAG